MATDEQRCAYLDEHLPYELKMLRFTRSQMSRTSCYLSWNAYLESFAVHARNIVNFLTNGDKGNMNAKDLLINYRARIGSESGPMNKLNQQVFHLAKDRSAESASKFNTDNVEAVTDWVEKNVKDFLSQLSEEMGKLFNEKRANPSTGNTPFLSITNRSQTSSSADPISVTVETKPLSSIFDPNFSRDR